MSTQRFKFTKEQEKFIKDNYLTMPRMQIARHCGCSDGVIIRYLKRKGLTIPKSVLQARKAKTMFQKGDSPHNKSKPQTEWMSEEAIAKSKPTRFKKGQVCHTARPLGDIRRTVNKLGRIYSQIKISDTEWEYLNRYIWRQHHGEIPENHNIIFLDSNTENFDIDNLALACNTELMLRNSHAEFPDEVIPSLVLISKINKKIKENE